MLESSETLPAPQTIYSGHPAQLHSAVMDWTIEFTSADTNRSRFQRCTYVATGEGADRLNTPVRSLVNRRSY